MGEKRQRLPQIHFSNGGHSNFFYFFLMEAGTFSTKKRRWGAKEKKRKKKGISTPFSHSSYSLQTPHAHTLVLLPAEHRNTPSYSRTQVNFSESNKINIDLAICGALWSLDSRNNLMIAGLINTIRQLVPADYLPLIANLTAVPPIKIKAQEKEYMEAHLVGMRYSRQQ